jgi:signal transduction histidine kinase
VRGFSHDVKNPLGAADGFLYLMEEGIINHLSEKQKESVGRARRSVGAALKLIESLTELARAEAGRIEIEWKPVDVREVAREMAEEYRAQAHAEYEQMRGPWATRMAELLGDDAAAHFVENWRVLTIVLDRGELRPGRLRARRP